MIVFLAVTACVSGSRGEDFDGDGVRTPLDCDDQNAFVFPGAFDVPYDGIDQDCSGSDVRDGDGDGYDIEEDCDDRSAAVNPGAEDPPYDGVDADCGGGSDFDADEDGSDSVDYGGDDCDDTDPTRSAEDDDGDGVSSCGGDCNDNRASVYPGAPRVCGNGLDDDCDGQPECGLTGFNALNALDAQIVGLSTDDHTGRALAVVDDLDGDGRRDLAVGAYQAYDGNGAVHLITRPRDGTLAQDHSLLVGSGSFGWSIAGTPGGVLVGSLTGSDYDWRGAAYLFEAPLAPVTEGRDATLILEGVGAGDRAGWAVAYAEMGLPWLVVGAPAADAGGTDTGAVYFVNPDWTGIHSLAQVIRVPGNDFWGRAGQSLAPTPDVSGDGLGDLWVGAPGGPVGISHPGTVHLVTALTAGSVATSGTAYVGEAFRDEFGASLAVGDANGDGVPDLLVGAPFNDTAAPDAGAAYLFHGPHEGVLSGLLSADLIVRGREGYELGASVALVDLDGDGFDDVVVGGPGASSDEGGVAVFDAGQTGSVDVLSGDAIVSGTIQSRAGIALAGGRLGGGPTPDLAIGADEAFVTAGAAGAVSVAWGGDGSF